MYFLSLRKAGWVAVQWPFGIVRSKTQNFGRKVLLGGSEGKTDGMVCVFEEKTNHSSHTSWNIHELPSVCKACKDRTIQQGGPGLWNQTYNLLAMRWTIVTKQMSKTLNPLNICQGHERFPHMWLTKCRSIENQILVQSIFFFKKVVAS